MSETADLWSITHVFRKPQLISKRIIIVQERKTLLLLQAFICTECYLIMILHIS